MGGSCKRSERRALLWAGVVGIVGLLATGCIYPRRGTSLTPVTREGIGSVSAPSGIWQLTVVDAQITPRKRGDLAWDDDGSGPDAYVRIYRGEELVFETPTIGDSLTPAWNATLPRNFHVPQEAVLRVEVWDRDTIGSDPIGQHRTRGLPVNAVSDADARLMLEGGSYVTIRVTAPRAHRGVGIEEYEVRPDGLVIARVLPHSPAGRASLVPGDTIVGIGERRVSSMSPVEAASALSMAAHRATQLTVRSREGRERTVGLDRGFAWLSM